MNSHRAYSLAALVLAVLVVAFVVSWNRSAKKERPLTIKVGTILGLTGENSAYGVKMRNGLQLAEDEINATGGVNGKKLDLIIEDSQWQPSRGVSIYRKLHDVDGVKLYTAICGSTIALAISEASKSDDVAIVDAISTAPKLTELGGDKYFRVCTSDAHAGQNNIEWALDEGAKTFLVVYVEDDWGTSYKDALVKALKEKGHSADTLLVSAQSRDLRTEAQKAVKVQPDAMFLAIYANLAVPFVRQAKENGLTAKIYGGDNLSSADFVVAGADATEGVRVSIPAEPDSSAYERFENSYRKKFQEDPDVFALKSYDALMLLAHSIDKVGTEPEKIIKYLKTMEPFPGASGPIAFDESGDLASQMYRRMIYRGGELTPWPKDSDTTKSDM